MLRNEPTSHALPQMDMMVCLSRSPAAAEGGLEGSAEEAPSTHTKTPSCVMVR